MGTRGQEKLSPGKKVSFFIDKLASGVAQIDFRITKIPPAGASAAQAPAMVEYAGSHMLEPINIKYGNQIVQTINTEKHVWEKKLTKHQILCEGFDYQMKGGQNFPLAQRQADWTQQEVFNYPLRHIWFDQKNGVDRMHMPEAYNTELEVEVRMKQADAFIWTNNGAAPAEGLPTFEIEMVIRYYDFPSQLHSQKLLHHRDDNGGGMLHKFVDVEYFTYTIPAGPVPGDPQTINIPLINFNKDVRQLTFLLGDESRADSPWSNDPYNDAKLHTIDTMAIINNGQVLKEPQTDYENRVIYRPRFYPNAQIGDRIYFLAFSEFPMDKRNSTYTFNFGNRSAMQLQITVTQSANPRIFYIWADNENLIHSVDGGIYKMLN
ncbi:MAG: hypothetical protein R3327_06525 [Nitrosopumilaceae archaeon]|nr:hypothetical protein [Nitrosopumilaceae archaeon]